MSELIMPSAASCSHYRTAVREAYKAMQCKECGGLCRPTITVTTPDTTGIIRDGFFVCTGKKDHCQQYLNIIQALIRTRRDGYDEGYEDGRCSTLW